LASPRQDSFGAIFLSRRGCGVKAWRREQSEGGGRNSSHGGQAKPMRDEAVDAGSEQSWPLNISKAEFATVLTGAKLST